jgi:hypothetical protein
MRFLDWFNPWRDERIDSPENLEARERMLDDAERNYYEREGRKLRDYR